jgi:hypothetical protein
MRSDDVEPRCNYDLLTAQLTAALVEADKCDPLVAIHVQTALDVLRERLGPGTQSSAR